MRVTRAAALYTWGISLAGLVLLGVAFVHLPEDRAGLWVIAGIAGLAELLSAPWFAFVPYSRVSVSSVLSLTVIVALDPWAGAIVGLVVGLATLALMLVRPRGQGKIKLATALPSAFFNTAMFVITAIVAGQVFVRTGGQVGLAGGWGNLPALLLAITVHELLNVALLIGRATLETDKTAVQLWKGVYAWSVPMGITSGLLGSSVLVLAYRAHDPLSLLVFLLPVLLAGYAFRLFIANSKVYFEQLEVANRSLEQANRSLERTNLELLETLGAIIDAYDVYTFGHSAQTALYVEALGKKLGLPPDQVSQMVKAALVHDIGKIGVTDAITGKPEPLTAEEYRLMQQHPLIGADILGRVGSLQPLTPIVRHHHERWDGKGYPAGLAGENIPLGARILTVADTLDAMLSNRPYRPGRTLAQVRQEIAAGAGKQFDPRIVEAMLQVIEEQAPDFFRDTSTIVEISVQDTRPHNYTPVQLSHKRSVLGQKLRFLKRSSLVGQIDSNSI